MLFLLLAVHLLICLFLIAVVLLQQGKGADLSVFGGGATQTAFGARGAATVLHKMTVVSFVLFIVTTLGIGIVQSDRGTSDIFEDLDEAAATADGGDAAENTAESGAATDDAAEAPTEEPQGAFAVESPTDDAGAESATDAVVEDGTGDEAGTDRSDS